MTEIGTLSELGALPGDTVESIDSISFGRVTLGDPAGTGFSYVNTETESLGTVTRWRMISRRPRTWGEMTDAEKGELLLAHHGHKQIEVQVPQHGSNWKRTLCPTWSSEFAYRIKPKPVVETVTLYGGSVPASWTFGHGYGNTHRITFTTTDGEPDCSSIKMERIDD